ncbi:hypothetical protein [Brachybacterium sp. ACRRE]|uniref:hypothetical protein n=1 Tax=Brachybacterium sp. ACRRE TaxID=2918184 RepID=UPI001EF19A02|nr:hypothetical protein [Brachybacterium sp. ACRRE]MCG7311280.1 hypothetical protein [Brachybacterium sp. ACRRE]
MGSSRLALGLGSAAVHHGGESVYAYNAHEHPELRDGRSRLVSFDVNSLEPDDLYADASIYRPRFLRIEF